MFKRLFLVFGLMSFFCTEAPGSCSTWFKKSKIKPKDADCLIKCTSLRTGMDTFQCSRECPHFCNIPRKEKILFDLIYYPGLTPVEQALLAKHPKEAFKVYQMKNLAEDITVKYFRGSAQLDESDAFRHFVWAALLVKEIGTDLAQKFLEAHETNNKEPKEDTAMDLANNRAGILGADQLKRENKLTTDNIEKEAVEALKFGKLIVLKPKGIMP